jgi:hypothetical protein
LPLPCLSQLLPPSWTLTFSQLTTLAKSHNFHSVKVVNLVDVFPHFRGWFPHQHLGHL